MEQDPNAGLEEKNQKQAHAAAAGLGGITCARGWPAQGMLIYIEVRNFERVYD